MSSTGQTWDRGTRGWVRRVLTRRQKALKAAAVGSAVADARARAARRVLRVGQAERAAAIARTTALRVAVG